MKSSFRLIVSALPGVVALGAAMLACAQPPPAPPGGAMMSAITKDNAAEASSKAAVRGWGALIDQGRIDQAFDKFVSKSFEDHSEMVRRMTGKPKVGFDDTVAVFKQMLAHESKDPMVQQMTADDNIVTIKGKLGQDIFRVEDGKITDHWDTLGGFTGAPAPGAAGPAK